LPKAHAFLYAGNCLEVEMRNFTLSVVLAVGVLAVTAVGQTPRLKIFIAPSDPAPSQISGRVTSVAVDPGDPVIVYRITAGDYPMVSDPATAQASVLAGQTVRLRIATANNRGHLLLKSSVPVSYAVPCEGPPRPPAVGVETSDLIITGIVSDTAFNWKTEAAWKGTCRVMVIELVDRWEYAIKVRFN
jgi:hypothetical protein